MTATLPISAIYVALSALLIVGLLLRVAWLRNSLKIGIGDGQQPILARAVRVHANAVECLPLALLLLVLVELSGAGPIALHGLGASLLVARLLHAVGLSRRSGYSFGRFFGTALTVGVILVSSGLLLWLNYGR